MSNREVIKIYHCNPANADAIITLLNFRLPAIIQYIKKKYDKMFSQFGENYNGWTIEGGYSGKAIIPCLDNLL